MLVDAVILAGGRSARLGGHAKADLRSDGMTLLERTIAAAAPWVSRVVVAGEAGRSRLAIGVPVVREQPPFGGPVAAIAAALPLVDADEVLVLACDMPGVAAALGPLLDGELVGDARIAVDRGREQPLVARYGVTALRAALTSSSVDGASMRALTGRLHVTRVAVPDGSTDDVDTPDDAARLLRPVGRSA